MRKAPFIIFDDYVVGATTSKPAYTSSKFNDVLGKFDQFTFECVVDNVTSSPNSLDVYIEHSPDGDHWLHANGTADNPPGTGGGDVKWGPLALSGTSVLSSVGLGNIPLFALARLQIVFGDATTGAHIRITVTPRDSR